MFTGHQKTADPGGPAKEKITREQQTGAGSDDSCRCKEVAKMTPRKLLGLMISDLAFWKKAEKR
jgi:hypothetical protein